MITRREWLKYSLATGAALTLDPRTLLALEGGAYQGKLLERPIPSSGEMLPMMGLGSSATFSRLAGEGEVEALREVLHTLVVNGGTVFDTAPSYGDSEAVAGELVNELGIAEKVFWATKVNVVPRGGDSADPQAARAQIETSFERIGTPKIDLIQVHNLADIPTQLGILKELKEEGRVRYIGTTSTNPASYDYLIEVMKREPLDFIGVDYAVDNLESAKTILPLAADRGIGVIINVPFGGGRNSAFDAVEGVELPEWASEFDCQSWGQFFLKYIISHPAVTCAIPGTRQVRHVNDNLGAAMGRLPDAAQRRRQEQFFDSL
jgi:aryl-alcohol dehydrogenase-like predicted oxidoreductase